MKFVICEVSSSSHMTYVESLLRICTAAAKNSVILVLKPKDAAIIREIGISGNLEIIEAETLEQAEDILLEINKLGIDQWLFPTIEPDSKSNQKLIGFILSDRLEGTINIGVHNIDIWFPEPLLTRIVKIWNTKFSWRTKYVLFKKFLFAQTGEKVDGFLKRKGGAFFIISQNLAKQLAKVTKTGSIRVLPFCVFDEVQYEALELNEADMRSGKATLAIPGFISNYRRDYLGFLNALVQYPNPLLKQSIRIDFLGTVSQEEGGDLIIEAAKKMTMDGWDIYWNNERYIPMLDFDRRLANCSLVAGILNVNLGGTSVYGMTKETGVVYNMIKTAKPGFLPSEYIAPAELNGSVISYENYRDLLDRICQFIEHPDKLDHFTKQALNNSRKYVPIDIFNREFHNAEAQNNHG